ncbi:beta-ketoacyl-ACP synthase III [Actinosynnema sp. NPDC053489]|uniref:beta-ketoacyl-ACP synthase III n=1 Tax=Actinosynnema sp. NPDC053489 TaxID=3363916 RepID=UPI0037CA4C05
MTAAVLAGLGAVVPDNLVTNDMLARRLDTSDEWIRSRTGIATRYAVGRGTATSDLAVGAGRRALESAGAEHVGMVVVATTTPDRPCPATGPEVAARLGLGRVPAYDIAAVCSGFLYGLAAGAGAIAAGIARDVLVIGAEAFSTIIDPEDRTTAVIFGDGAGAVVLRAGDRDEPGALLDVELGSDGGLVDLITVPAGGSRQRTSGREPEPGDRYFRMQGRAVFEQAVLRMTEAAEVVLGRQGLTSDQVDRFVGHQANVRILRAVAHQLGVPAERNLINVDRVGNTSAASIPLALADAAAEGRLSPGHRVLACAFGGGATWGSALFTWPDITVG